MQGSISLQDDVLKILDDKKAVNIVPINVSDSIFKNKLSSCYIIASGTSSRHMQSVADYVYRHLKQEGFSPCIEGNAQTGWVLIEADGIEIHLFKPELREYYDLEGLLNYISG